MDRDTAYKLLCDNVKSDALRKHALTVEAVMRHFAEKTGEDPEFWSVVGLLHDIDYERFPDQHCIKAAEILSQAGCSEQIIHAVCSHGWEICSDVEPIAYMEKILFALDELTGLIAANAIMRPSKSVHDLESKSVKKKFKDKHFAAGVDRGIIKKGLERLDMDLDTAITECILAMRKVAPEIGLQGNI